MATPVTTIKTSMIVMPRRADLADCIRGTRRLMILASAVRSTRSGDGRHPLAVAAAPAELIAIRLADRPGPGLAAGDVDGQLGIGQRLPRRRARASAARPARA